MKINAMTDQSATPLNTTGQNNQSNAARARDVRLVEMQRKQVRHELNVSQRNAMQKQMTEALGQALKLLKSDGDLSRQSGS